MSSSAVAGPHVFRSAKRYSGGHVATTLPVRSASGLRYVVSVVDPSCASALSHTSPWKPGRHGVFALHAWRSRNWHSGGHCASNEGADTPSPSRSTRRAGQRTPSQRTPVYFSAQGPPGASVSGARHVHVSRSR